MNTDLIQPDYIEAGEGDTVILVHSSVAGAGQWRGLMNSMENKAHLVAINLYGYGKTPSWPAHDSQTLGDQARLLEPLIDGANGSVSIVGHSFGGSVAMKAASLYGDRVSRLVLIEPNPFYLLEQHHRTEAYAEAVALRDTIKLNGAREKWSVAAESFANYWTGEGSWQAMPDKRKDRFVQALKPNFYEWDAVMNEQTALSEWVHSLPERTVVISAVDTVRSIAEIIQLFRQQAGHWKFVELEKGGHTAVMTMPEVVNEKIQNALGLIDLTGV